MVLCKMLMTLPGQLGKGSSLLHDPASVSPRSVLAVHVEFDVTFCANQRHQVGKASLILAQLSARLGAIAAPQSNAIQTLSSPQLDALAIALLNFTSSRDVEQWLAQSSQESAG